VTGGAGWLGGAFAEALAEAGACVVVSSRDQKRAEAAAAELPRPHGAEHAGVQLDQLDPATVDSGFDAALEAAGQLDVLIDNGHAWTPNDWTDVSAEQFGLQLANATGYFLLARRMRDHLVRRGIGGSIVLVGSMYGVVGSYPDAYEGVAPASSVAYHTLKGGIVQMTRHLAVYWARDGIRVNCLSPGAFPKEEANAEMVRRLNGKNPMKRMGRPWELKGALLFLASDASSYVTGQNLLVDGGWTAW
jgi:NAD(P)-dependent dehydrogenase (short-subunit alcohol dehydrogenase family)